MVTDFYVIIKFKLKAKFYRTIINVAMLYTSKCQQWKQLPRKIDIG